jgi:hypothetical protein
MDNYSPHSASNRASVPTKSGDPILRIANAAGVSRRDRSAPASRHSTKTGIRTSCLLVVWPRPAKQMLQRTSIKEALQFASKAPRATPRRRGRQWICPAHRRFARWCRTTLTEGGREILVVISDLKFIDAIRSCTLQVVGLFAIAHAAKLCGSTLLCSKQLLHGLTRFIPFIIVSHHIALNQTKAQWPNLSAMSRAHRGSADAERTRGNSNRPSAGITMSCLLTSRPLTSSPPPVARTSRRAGGGCGRGGRFWCGSG